MLKRFLLVILSFESRLMITLEYKSVILIFIMSLLLRLLNPNSAKSRVDYSISIFKTKENQMQCFKRLKVFQFQCIKFINDKIVELADQKSVRLQSSRPRIRFVCLVIQNTSDNWFSKLHAWR